jgi:hypothetical protein
MPDDHQTTISLERGRLRVQVVLGYIVDFESFPFRPDGEVAFVGCPPGAGKELAEAFGVGPLVGLISRRITNGGYELIDDAGCTARQPDESA